MRAGGRLKLLLAILEGARQRAQLQLLCPAEAVIVVNQGNVAGCRIPCENGVKIASSLLDLVGKSPVEHSTWVAILDAKSWNMNICHRKRVAMPPSRALAACMHLCDDQQCCP